MSNFFPKNRRYENTYSYSQRDARRGEREPERRTTAAQQAEEDYLLQQIDEFREKAAHLQDLITTKESRARQLQNMLDEQGREAEGLSTGIAHRIDRLLEHMDDRFDEVNDNIARRNYNEAGQSEIVHVDNTEVERALLQLKDEIKKIPTEMPAQQTEVTTDLSEIKEPLAELKAALEEIRVTEPLAELKAALEEIRDKEPAAPQVEIDMAAFTAPVDEVKDTLSEVKATLEELKNAPAPEVKVDFAEVKTPIDEMKTDLAGMKSEIMEKIHAEDVQVFRNTKNLIEEQAANDQTPAMMSKEFKSVRSYLKILSWFSIINFVVLVAYVLYALGVFKF